MPTTRDTPQLLTAGRIADRLAVPLHRVLYVLRTRPHIRAAPRAGTLRLYSEAAVACVAAELEAIDTRRAKEVTQP